MKRASSQLQDGPAGHHLLGRKKQDGSAKKPRQGGALKKKPHPAAAENKAARRAEAKALRPLRQKLPIYGARAELLAAVGAAQVTVVVGETGSGKTTQLPQFLSESKSSGGLMIAVTQPRRVAAMTVAARVAKEVGCELGAKVGYSIRFEDKSSPATRIKYMTDGMLLREAVGDPQLSKYGVVVLDEAHERTVHTDVLFALAKRVISTRRDLKIIVMSATLEADKYAKYFGGTSVLYVAGRQFPVDVFYTKEPQQDYVDAALTTTLQVHMDRPNDGDILVFMTGQEEIQSLERLLTQRCRLLPPEAPKLVICPIFAALPQHQQLKVFEPTPAECRKVIIATNIAETSITVSGLRYVIDAGLVKQRQFNAKTGMDLLKVLPISQAQARQRSGRAGREAAGRVYRLYTEEQFHALAPSTTPEILRSNMSTVMLQLLALGVDNPLEFDFMDRPSANSMKRAVTVLLDFGAIEMLMADGERAAILLTNRGKQMAELPLDPRYSTTMICSAKYGCGSEVATIISMLSAENIFYSGGQVQRAEAELAKKRFTSRDGDHATMLNVYDAWEGVNGDAQWCRDNFINARSMKKAKDVRLQLLRICKRLSLPMASCGSDREPLLKCLAAGLFQNAARKAASGRPNEYLTLSDQQQVFLHPSSVLCSPHLKPEERPDVLVYSELTFTSRCYLRDVSTVQYQWLLEAAPQYFSTRAPG